ncbi:Ribokinase [Minicystis rosea]|nr:Ribokinase [Minicystis rosea]
MRHARSLEMRRRGGSDGGGDGRDDRTALPRGSIMVFLVAGDANADVSATLARFPREGDDSPLLGLGWTSGGSSANVATAIARLDARARLFARVGTDPAADVALRAAKSAGVDLSAVQRDLVIATGLCFAAVSPGGERTFFSHRGANVALAEADAEAIFREVSWLHVGGHALLEGAQRATTLDLVAEAQRRGVPVSLDLCLPLIDAAPELVIELVPRLRALLGNEREMHAFACALDPSLASHDAMSVASMWAIERFSGVSIAVKLGRTGCTVGDDAWICLPGFTVAARDTTGCGDAFVAGFLLALARGASIEAAGCLGNALGALTATRAGAAEALPSLAEVRTFLTEHGELAALAVLDVPSA